MYSAQHLRCLCQLQSELQCQVMHEMSGNTAIYPTFKIDSFPLSYFPKKPFGTLKEQLLVFETLGFQRIICCTTCLNNRLILSPIYTAENFWRGLDESGTRTKKIVLITHLHVLFSTVLNDVKL